MYKTEFEYILKQPFPYANSGQQVQASKITIKAPSNFVMVQANIIETCVAEAQRKATENATALFQNVSGDIKEYFEGLRAKEEENKEKVEEVNPAELLRELTANGLDLTACMTALGKIMSIGSTTAMIDDKEPFKAMHFDQMSSFDTKSILGEYIKVFLLMSQ